MRPARGQNRARTAGRIKRAVFERGWGKGGTFTDSRRCRAAPSPRSAASPAPGRLQHEARRGGTRRGSERGVKETSRLEKDRSRCLHQLPQQLRVLAAPPGWRQFRVATGKPAVNRPRSLRGLELLQGGQGAVLRESCRRAPLNQLPIEHRRILTCRRQAGGHPAAAAAAAGAVPNGSGTAGAAGAGGAAPPPPPAEEAPFTAAKAGVACRPRRLARSLAARDGGNGLAWRRRRGGVAREYGGGGATAAQAGWRRRLERAQASPGRHPSGVPSGTCRVPGQAALMSDAPPPVTAVSVCGAARGKHAQAAGGWRGKR